MSAAGQWNSLTRLADDSCAITTKDIRSIGPGDYAVGEKRINISKADATAVANPTFVVSATYGNTVPSLIDEESILRNHQVQTHTLKYDHSGTRPQPRPFATVPYMGGGRGNADVESNLIHPLMVRCGPACGGSVAEAPWPVFTPLIPQVSRDIHTVSNWVEESAAPGWIRSGLPSRIYARDNCY